MLPPELVVTLTVPLCLNIVLSNLELLKVPDVILEAARLGIRASANVPEVMSDAAWVCEAVAKAEVLEVAALPRPKDDRPVEAFNPVDPPSHLLRSVYAVFQLETFASLAPVIVPPKKLPAPLMPLLVPSTKNPPSARIYRGVYMFLFVTLFILNQVSSWQPISPTRVVPL